MLQQILGIGLVELVELVLLLFQIGTPPKGEVELLQQRLQEQVLLLFKRMIF